MLREPCRVVQCLEFSSGVCFSLDLCDCSLWVSLVLPVPGSRWVLLFVPKRECFRRNAPNVMNETLGNIGRMRFARRWRKHFRQYLYDYVSKSQDCGCWTEVSNYHKCQNQHSRKPCRIVLVTCLLVSLKLSSDNKHERGYADLHFHQAAQNLLDINEEGNLFVRFTAFESSSCSFACFLVFYWCR